MFDWVLNTFKWMKFLGDKRFPRALNFLWEVKRKIGRNKSSLLHKSSVIRQKGESQNGSNKKTKHAKFSEKTNTSSLRTSIRWYEMFTLRKIWRNLFSCYLRFEIRPLALLSTKYSSSDIAKTISKISALQCKIQHGI